MAKIDPTDIVGQAFKNNTYGNYTIVEYCGKTNGTHRYFIEFENTGYVKDVARSMAINKKVVDDMAKRTKAKVVKSRKVKAKYNKFKNPRAKKEFYSGDLSG